MPKVSDEFALSMTQEAFRYSIMDSGIFTLMYGALGGKKDKKFLDVWYDEMVKLVSENNIRSTLVEIDCQKVLGVNEAWEYRERLRKDLPNNRQINVFHLEDGQKGLDRLIEYTDYIAVGAPELRRSFGMGKYGEVIYRLVDHIKSRKPNIDIHLLGCTDKKILRRCRDCTSADSTSFLSAVKHGRFLTKRTNLIKKELIKCEARDLDPSGVLRNEMGKELTPGMCKYIRTLAASAIFHKEFYALHCGSQD